ncbi:MAG: hypothetical protein AAF950_01250 [Pseudomonadota bacterium]
MLFRPPEDQTGNGEDGYLLLEVLIGVAISSSLIYLLLASLNGLSRSQERTIRVIEDVSQRVFERGLTDKFFRSVRPVYRTEENGFEGNRTDFSGRTYLEGVGSLRGAEFTVALTPNGRSTDMIMTSEGTSYRLMAIDGQNCRFEYLPLEGGFSETWRDPFVAGKPINGSSSNSYFIRYAKPVPRQIRLHCAKNRLESLIGVWPLGTHDWPAPRDSDRASSVPF